MKRITQADITVSKLQPSGMWEVCVIVGSYLVRRRFDGYTKQEAVRRFLAYVNNKS